MAYPRNYSYDWANSSTSSTRPYWVPEDENTFVADRINPFHLPESFKKEMAQNIADQIDEDILRDLLRQANYKNTTHLKAVKFKPENLWSEPND